MSIPLSFVKSEYSRLNPEGRWFDCRTLRFFNCRLPRNAHGVPDGYLFVTSERCDMVGDSRRLYSVRYMSHAGQMQTIGVFNSYPTQSAAMQALRVEQTRRVLADLQATA